MATVEVVFDPIKHSSIQKGSIVGFKSQIGVLIYNMPSVGAIDRDVDALKEADNQMKSQAGRQVFVGSAKRVKKEQAKSRRRAAKQIYGA